MVRELAGCSLLLQERHHLRKVTFAVRRQPEAKAQSVGRAGSTLLQHPLTEETGRFDQLGIV